jgi:hypothetical protein
MKLLERMCDDVAQLFVDSEILVNGTFDFWYSTGVLLPVVVRYLL